MRREVQSICGFWGQLHGWKRRWRGVVEISTVIGVLHGVFLDSLVLPALAAGAAVCPTKPGDGLLGGYARSGRAAGRCARVRAGRRPCRWPIAAAVVSQRKVDEGAGELVKVDPTAVNRFDLYMTLPAWPPTPTLRDLFRRRVLATCRRHERGPSTRRGRSHRAGGRGVLRSRRSTDR